MRMPLVLLACILLLDTARPLRAQAASRAAVDSIVGRESERTRQDLRAVRAAVDSLRSTSKPWPETWGGILVGILAAVSGFGVAAYASKRAADDARDARLETHLYDALKWFEGTTQKRSIGLSVIEGNWLNAVRIRTTWRGVLINQAAFLLSSSDTDTEHERQNLDRIRILLSALSLDQREQAALAHALATRNPGAKKGMPNIDEAPWRILAGQNKPGP
jgi:hypothetical protein